MVITFCFLHDVQHLWLRTCHPKYAFHWCVMDSRHTKLYLQLRCVCVKCSCQYRRGNKLGGMNENLRSRGATVRITSDGRTLRHIPLGDLILQTELRVATEQNILAYPCLCKDCRGGRRKRIHVIRTHHTSVGRDPFLTRSMIGGDPIDGYPPYGVWVEDIAFDNDVIDVDPGLVNNDVVGNDIVADHVFGNAVDEVDCEDVVDGAGTSLDEHHDVQRQVMEAFAAEMHCTGRLLTNLMYQKTRTATVTHWMEWKSCSRKQLRRCILAPRQVLSPQ